MPETYLTFPSVTVRDKATALQYALEATSTAAHGKRELDIESAKEVFKLFCDNVNLPDVSCNGCCCPPILNSNNLEKVLL